MIQGTEENTKQKKSEKRENEKEIRKKYGIAEKTKQKKIQNGKKEIIMKKTIITVVGRDTVGIIAKVCTYLAENNINILDISQTIVSGYFNMMMVTDASAATKPSGEIADEMEALGDSMNLSIRCMHEDIFNSMHRI